MPIEDLTPEQRRDLEEALRQAFDPNSLSRMLRLYMGLRLEDEVFTGTGFRNIITGLVDFALQTSSVDKVVRNALRERGGNLKLQKVARELGIGAPPDVDVSTKNQAALEKLVRKRSHLLDYAAFQERLGRLQRQICRIDIPDGTALGTGWLVGPDLLLTAYHVVEEVVNGPYDTDDVLCRFDFSADGDAGRTCGLAPGGVLDYSPYAQADLGTSTSPPTEDELDYALLRLDARVGEDDAGAQPRGWIRVPERPAVVDTDDFMLIPQHPAGAALKLAFGEVLKYDSGGFRLRYDTSTDNGSSGAPCFDLDLAPFGIHHASGPRHDQAFNQCVPLRPVLHHIQRRNKAGADIPAFWS